MAKLMTDAKTLKQSSVGLQYLSAQGLELIAGNIHAVRDCIFQEHVSSLRDEEYISICH